MEDARYARLVSGMAAYDRGSPKRIQHFVKVHAFARAIGIREGLDAETMNILETAALIHDIGIRNALRKYGSSAGPYQEAEGAAEAGPFLREIGGYSGEEIDRIVFLVGHHHTYAGIDGMDWRILVEADFLVNLYENNAKYASLLAAEKIFETAAGRELMEEMFGAAGESGQAFGKEGGCP